MKLLSLSSKQYVSNGGTAMSAGHLRSKHPRKLHESFYPRMVPIARASSLLSALANACNSSAQPISKETANQFLLNWIISSNQAFSMIEQDSFRELVQYLQPRYQVSKADHTIRNWIIYNYYEQQSED